MRKLLEQWNASSPPECGVALTPSFEVQNGARHLISCKVMPLYIYTFQFTLFAVSLLILGYDQGPMLYLLAAISLIQARIPAELPSSLRAKRQQDEWPICLPGRAKLV